MKMFRFEDLGFALLDLELDTAAVNRGPDSPLHSLFFSIRGIREIRAKNAFNAFNDFNLSG